MMDIIFSQSMLSVLNLEDIVKTNCYCSQLDQFVHPWSFEDVRMILNCISNIRSRGVVYLGLYLTEDAET